MLLHFVISFLTYTQNIYLQEKKSKMVNKINVFTLVNFKFV